MLFPFPKLSTVPRAVRRRQVLTARTLEVLGRGALARAIMGHASTDAGVGPVLVLVDPRDPAGARALELVDEAAVFLVDVDGERVAVLVLDVDDAGELLDERYRATPMAALPLPELRIVTIAAGGVRVGEVVLEHARSEVLERDFTRGAA